uniref:proline-rich protein 2-like n=1 Tax=Nyctereutes procyonoides TaxID=34880 RepID=UPI0024444831|nr:proline-rich protein 2-like [Nyctereutes procyonoides]
MAPPSLPTGSSRPASVSGPLRPRVCTHFAFGARPLGPRPAPTGSLALSRSLQLPCSLSQACPPPPRGHVPRPLRTKPSRCHGHPAGRASGTTPAGPSIVTSRGSLHPRPRPLRVCPPPWAGGVSGLTMQGTQGTEASGGSPEGHGGLRVHPADPRGPARPPGSRKVLRPLETSNAVPLPPGQSSPRGHTPSPERLVCAEELLGHTHFNKIINAVRGLRNPVASVLRQEDVAQGRPAPGRREDAKLPGALRGGGPGRLRSPHDTRRAHTHTQSHAPTHSHSRALTRTPPGQWEQRAASRSPHPASCGSLCGAPAPTSWPKRPEPSTRGRSP